MVVPKRMVDHLVNALVERKIEAKPLNLTYTDMGEVALDLVDATTMVIASPTVLTGPHPSVSMPHILQMPLDLN